MAVNLTADDFLKTKGILTCGPDDTLNAASLKLNSSHDAVFVVDNDEVLGVINPYHSIFASHHPGHTKTKNCYFSPPKLKPSTPIDRIAKLMLESKVYYLPVFDDQENWLGIVTVRRLLRAISQDKSLRQALPSVTSTRKLITISDDETIDHAYALLKKSGISRLPVIGNTGQLVGLITRHSLRGILTEPISSPRKLSRSGQKHKKLDQPVTSYTQNDIVTVNKTADLKHIVDLMLERQVGSVIVVNGNNRPVDLISHQDLLTALSRSA